MKTQFCLLIVLIVLCLTSVTYAKQNSKESSKSSTGRKFVSTVKRRVHASFADNGPRELLGAFELKKGGEKKSSKSSKSTHKRTSGSKKFSARNNGKSNKEFGKKIIDEVLPLF
jgi:hypothetical protein